MNIKMKMRVRDVVKRVLSNSKKSKTCMNQIANLKEERSKLYAENDELRSHVEILQAIIVINGDERAQDA